MASKKLKKTLLTTIYFILFIELLALINLYISTPKGYELGSVSDWLNTAGTLGTLIVAYFAYRKVPEWMAQKHYDIAYGIIEKSIFNDLPDIRSTSLHFQTSISAVLHNFKKTVGTGTPTNLFIIDTVDQLDKLSIKFQQESSAIINQLNTVERINYELSDTAQTTISKLNSASEIYYQTYEQLYALYEDIMIEYSLEPEQRKKYTDKIDDMLKTVKETNTSLTEHINEIYNKNKPISDFITPKKQTPP